MRTIPQMSSVVLFLHLLSLAALALCSSARVRVYYLGIDHENWDFYPVHAANRSLNAGPFGDYCTARPFASDQLLFVGDGTSLGSFTPTSVYPKLRFREYTNNKFTKRKTRRKEERHLGLLGPVLRATVGETIRVYVRGVVSGDDAFGFQVNGLEGSTIIAKPGQVVRYEFYVDPRLMRGGMVKGRMLLYRGVLGGGVDGEAGVYRGLLGAAIVYPSGGLNRKGKPIGVHTELVTVLWVANENTGDEEEEEEESNLMHGINGRLYCSLKGLDVVEGEVTRWYFGAVGNEVDIHVAHVHGLVGMDNSGAHTDSIRLLPYSTAAIELIPDSVGTWLMHCHINDHIHAGMQSLFTVHPATSPVKKTNFTGARERVYYVQAEDRIWDYTPLGRNECDDSDFGEEEQVFTQARIPVDLENEFEGTQGFTIGSRYLKSRYVQYTDATFATKVEHDENMAHLGLMGPVLRARVGEVIVVHFRNKASRNVSMHPHGVLYTKGQEGSPYNDGSSELEKLDDAIAPNGSFTYRWEVPKRAGPGPGEQQDVKLWMYHSHRNEIADTYAGLFGPILVVGWSSEYDDESLLPSDGTREIFLHMSVMDEGGSFHLPANVQRDKGNQGLTEDQLNALLEDETFQESNLMHSINGYLYCNGPLIKIKENHPTRFYFYSLGSEVDIHTPMIGQEVLQFDTRSSRGSGTLYAGTFSSAVVIPRHTGLQEIRCNVNDHIIAGMRALYFVEEHQKSVDESSYDVTHFIAADEVEWNYTPLGKDGCSGEDFGDAEMVFTAQGLFRPGSRYLKAVYREYQDSSFTTLMEQNETSFTGVVGPLLHFEAGEMLESSTLGTIGVPPQMQTTYLLRVPSEAAPSGKDLSSVPYVYYSSVDSIAHTAAGLTGVIAVTERGRLKKPARLPLGTSRTVPLLFNIFRENESPLLRQSLMKYADVPSMITEKQLEMLMDDDDWLESNAMHSMNGYMYGNSPLLTAKRGSTIRFYVFGYGSESSMHSPVWSGQIVHGRTVKSTSAHGVQILPFNAESVDVVLVTAGTWPVYCGVADHVLGGMNLCIKVE